MFPYQIYKVLTDQRLSELRAEARHHATVAEARRARRHPAAQPSRARDASRGLLALLRVRHDALPKSTMTPPSGTSPMGCVA